MSHFKALDAITRAELQRWLSDVLGPQQTAPPIMVTHDVEEALMLGDRVLSDVVTDPGGFLLELDVDLPRPRPNDVVRESQIRRTEMAACFPH